MQVDFDTYGFNGANKISNYKYNQIVPQLIIGWGGTNPSSPGGFDYVNSNKSSTWFLQVRLEVRMNPAVFHSTSEVLENGSVRAWLSACMCLWLVDPHQQYVCNNCKSHSWSSLFAPLKPTSLQPPWCVTYTLTRLITFGNIPTVPHTNLRGKLSLSNLENC